MQLLYCCFASYTEITLNEVHTFLTTSYHIPLQDPTLNGVSVTHHTSLSVCHIMIDYRKLQSTVLDTFQWYNIHTKFRQIPSRGSQVQML